MNWQDTEEYKKARADHDRRKARSDKLRLDYPKLYDKKKDLGLDAFELVHLEMLHAAGNTTKALDLALLLADLVYRWKKERNPYYMDKALMICSNRGLTPSPALMEAITEAAMARYTGGTGTLKTTSESIERETRKQAAFLLMMYLIYAGETLERAASRTSQWMKDVLKVKPIRASSLDKYYVKEIRKTGTEKKRFKMWDRCAGEAGRDEAGEQWAQFINRLPEADDELKGNRRD